MGRTVSNHLTHTRFEVHWGDENTITAAEVLLPVKKLKVWKAAGCGQIRSQMPKP